jgi:phage tail-like protein
MSAIDLPLIGFHFRVDFILTKKSKSLEGRFQKIDGLKKEWEFEKKMEGENTVEVKSPLRTKEGNLTLRRGLIVPSKKNSPSGFFDLLAWFEENINENRRIPIPMVVTALNANHDPEQSWFFYNTYPISWSTSGFDAMNGSSIIMEEVVLNYDTFKQVDTSGMKTSGIYQTAVKELKL